MSNLVVVDDFRANVATGTPLPQVLYNPANWWRSNAACDGCDVENNVASSLLRSTANDGELSYLVLSIQKSMIYVFFFN
jgi:hypothetical protein